MIIQPYPPLIAQYIELATPLLELKEFYLIQRLNSLLLQIKQIAFPSSKSLIDYHSEVTSLLPKFQKFHKYGPSSQINKIAIHILIGESLLIDAGISVGVCSFIKYSHDPLFEQLQSSVKRAYPDRAPAWHNAACRLWIWRLRAKAGFLNQYDPSLNNDFNFVHYHFNKEIFKGKCFPIGVRQEDMRVGAIFPPVFFSQERLNNIWDAFDLAWDTLLKYHAKKIFFPDGFSSTDLKALCPLFLLQINVVAIPSTQEIKAWRGPPSHIKPVGGIGSDEMICQESLLPPVSPLPSRESMVDKIESAFNCNDLNKLFEEVYEVTKEAFLEDYKEETEEEWSKKHKETLPYLLKSIWVWRWLITNNQGNNWNILDASIYKILKQLYEALDYNLFIEIFDGSPPSTIPAQIHDIKNFTEKFDAAWDTFWSSVEDYSSELAIYQITEIFENNPLFLKQLGKKRNHLTPQIISQFPLFNPIGSFLSFPHNINRTNLSGILEGLNTCMSPEDSMIVMELAIWRWLLDNDPEGQWQRYDPSFLDKAFHVMAPVVGLTPPLQALFDQIWDARFSALYDSSTLMTIISFDRDLLLNIKRVIPSDPIRGLLNNYNDAPTFPKYKKHKL